MNRRSTVLFGKKNKQSAASQRKGPGRPPKSKGGEADAPSSPGTPGPGTRKRTASTASLDNPANSPAAKKTLTYADGPSLDAAPNLFTTVHKESFLQYRSHSFNSTDIDTSSESGSTDDSTSECGDSKESSSENGEGGVLMSTRYFSGGQYTPKI